MTNPANKNDPVKLSTDGSYETVDLRKPVTRVCLVQSRVRAVDVNNLDATRKDNLDHMLGLIDAANGWLGPKDLVCFHEFPITGFDARWNREAFFKSRH